jgi:hypothetical protein
VKLKDLAAVILALSALVTSLAGFVKTLKTEQEQGALYQNAALQSGDQAEEVMALRAELAALKKETKR